MRPAARAAITAGSIVLVAALALVFRTLNASGVFTDVVPVFAGTCNAVRGVAGPEDIIVDEKLGVAFVSASDRRAKERGATPVGDGLYVLPLKGPARLTKVMGTPADFHPHGISLVRAANSDATLMVVNHRSDGASSIDTFDVLPGAGTVTLRETGSIAGGLLVSPNAIAAVDRDRFYVTNDHTSATAFGRMLDNNLVLPRANVLYFDGTSFHVVAQGLNFPSGAVLSPDGKYLYVSEAYERKLTTYSRNAMTGALDQVNTLPIASILDDLRFDPAGNLWVGSHPKAFASAEYRSDASRPSPSEIFRIALLNGIPQAATLVYANMGEEIGGASVAAVLGHRMLIGSPWDDKILDCTMDH